MAEAQLFGLQDEFTCSVCLDTVTDPVSIPCGHNFCLKCLTNYWDQKRVCSCPQCRHPFTTRPELKRNTLLNEVDKKLKKMTLSSPSSQNYAGPGDVECDFCTGKKFRAVKSCLTCPASYCQTHLQPHYEVAALKHHKLVDPDRNMKKKLCEKHQKSLEIFCKTDDSCICMMCVVTGHKNHEMVELETERKEKEVVLIYCGVQAACDALYGGRKGGKLLTMAEAQLFVSQDKFTCSVCLDTLTDPVTIPCGHNFCLKCLTDCWEKSQESSCPQCRENFTKRPALRRNNLLNEVIKKLKKMTLSSPPPQNYAGPGDVECDFCTGKKFRAVKSCLTCPASYCQTHLQPHYEGDALKHHKLVDSDRNLKMKLCEKHQKSLEIFCKTDDSCICMMCVVTGHNGHKMVELETEREEKQMSVVREVEENEKNITALIRCINEAHKKLTERIREEEKREMEKAEGVMERLEKEIEELKRREAELKELSETKDHLHFLQQRCRGPVDVAPAIIAHPPMPHEAPATQPLSPPADTASPPLPPPQAGPSVPRTTAWWRKKKQEADELARQQGIPPKQRKKIETYICKCCGQSNTKEFGHSQFGGEFFCSTSAGKTVQEWLEEKRREKQNRAGEDGH
ncbi:TRI25 ligase, partial [Polypterus senegalus]